MVRRKSSSQPQPQQLLVEGDNDRHVIWALCKQYNIPQIFSVELPDEEKTKGV